MEPIQKRLGRQIRHIRKMRKISQSQLAEAADVSDNFVGLIERGERLPALETVERIAKALNVDLKELFSFSASKDEKEKVISELGYKLRGRKLEDVKIVSQIAEEIAKYLK